MIFRGRLALTAAPFRGDHAVKRNGGGFEALSHFSLLLRMIFSEKR
jgi:hypothetical protein